MGRNDSSQQKKGGRVVLGDTPYIKRNISAVFLPEVEKTNLGREVSRNAENYL